MSRVGTTTMESRPSEPMNGDKGYDDGSWTVVGQNGKLDAVRKGGKAVGKAGGDNGKRTLVCDNCGGEGHPKILCASPPGAKGKGGFQCNYCKGFGHMGKDRTSSGGGQYKPPEARKGGNTKGGKAWGKWKSQHFLGKVQA